MIDYKIAKQMVRYFEDLQVERDLTSNEKYLLEEFRGSTNTFIVSCLTREDIEAQGYDASNIDDATMERIADKMGEAFNEDGIYWTSINYQCDWAGVPVKEDYEEENDDED